MRPFAALSPSVVRVSRIAALVAVGDLAAKAVAARLWAAESFRLTSFLSLSLVQNHDGAFGWSAGAYTWQLNLALTLAAVAFVIPVTRELSRIDPEAPVALGLILGGALGNLASLIAPPAGVGDFIALQVNPGHSVVLNVADLAAYAGLALILRTGFRIAGALLSEVRGAGGGRVRVGSLYAIKSDARRQLRRVRIPDPGEVVIADWDNVADLTIVRAEVDGGPPDPAERPVRAPRPAAPIADLPVRRSRLDDGPRLVD